MSRTEDVLLMVQRNGLTLQQAAAPFKADLDLVRAAVWENGLALQYAAAPLKAILRLYLQR